MLQVFLSIVVSGVAATEVSSRLLKTDPKMFPHVELITLLLRGVLIIPLFAIFLTLCTKVWQ
ncbi:MAG: hypothetical protein H6953_14450 [Chromatiaceae bacterium]|nr:hypothetical protein [Gammaproteobacteria bacterium]MCP5301377.1 hypothetical protein [Chromatiaceae bacterium]MCP5306642.1 hypothetical protein [Chromatiaceae bacterium]MCP5421857.1 hypothetical protein [Chromatiaceae bacterium]